MSHFIAAGTPHHELALKLAELLRQTRVRRGVGTRTVAEVTPAGDVIRKNALRPQSIDLAVAAILAVEAAASVVEPPKPVIW